MTDHLIRLKPESLFDKAIIGVASKPIGDGKSSQNFLIYDYQKVIELTIERDGCSNEEAEEHYQFSIISTYVGDSQPAFLFKRGSIEFEHFLYAVEVDPKSIDGFHPDISEHLLGFYEKCGEENVPVYAGQFIPGKYRDSVVTMKECATNLLPSSSVKKLRIS